MEASALSRKSLEDMMPDHKMIMRGSISGISESVIRRSGSAGELNGLGRDIRPED